MVKVNKIDRIRLDERCGEGYLVLTVVMLGFSVILMSLALDGLGMAVTYRRAVGLATVGAQAGAGSLAMFGGGIPALSGDACSVAMASVRASARPNANSQSLNARCAQDASGVAVTVELRPLKFFGGPLALAVQRVSATARAAPRYGINTEE